MEMTSRGLMPEQNKHQKEIAVFDTKTRKANMSPVCSKTHDLLPGSPLMMPTMARIRKMITMLIIIPNCWGPIWGLLFVLFAGLWSVHMKYIPGVSIRVFLNEITIWLGVSVKQKNLLNLEGCHPIHWEYEWNQMQQKETFALSFCFIVWAETPHLLLPLV